MDMTSKRTINSVKGKKFFQETVKAEPVTEANLEQTKANQVPIRDRFISDIAHDFPVTSDDLKDVLHEMSKKFRATRLPDSKSKKCLLPETSPNSSPTWPQSNSK